MVLVEDDEAIAMIVRYNLERLGCSVQHFTIGTAALQNLMTEAPDLVVLDWLLPGISGIEILRRMRASQIMRAVPVIMLTGYTESCDQARALSSGADRFFTKPFSVAEFVEVSRNLMICNPTPNEVAAAGGR